MSSPYESLKKQYKKGITLMKKIVAIVLVFGLLMTASVSFAAGLKKSELKTRSGHVFKYSMPSWYVYTDEKTSTNFENEWQTMIVGSEGVMAVLEIDTQIDTDEPAQTFAELAVSGYLGNAGTKNLKQEAYEREDGSYMVLFSYDDANGFRENFYCVVYATPGSSSLYTRYRMMVVDLIYTSNSSTQSWNDIKLLAEGVTLLSK